MDSNKEKGGRPAPLECRSRSPERRHNGHSLSQEACQNLTHPEHAHPVEAGAAAYARAKGIEAEPGEAEASGGAKPAAGPGDAGLLDAEINGNSQEGDAEAGTGWQLPPHDPEAHRFAVESSKRLAEKNKREGIGYPSLETWLISLFGAEDTKLNRWASKAIFLSCVQRTMEPGCLLRQIVVLIGAQDIGKSAVLRSLFPPEQKYDRWFTDAWDPTEGKQKQAEALQRVVLAEAGELAVSTKGDLDALKASITFATATFSQAYAST